MPKPAETATTRSSHGRREEVLDTALRMFAAKGYRATTIEEIARELDFTPAALYYYVKGKQALLTQIVFRPIDALLEEAARIDAGDASPADKFAAAVRAHMRLIGERQEWFTIMLREQLELEPPELATLREKDREYRKFLTRFLDEAVQRGDLSTSNTSVAVLTVVGALNWTLQWFRDGGAMDADDVADIINRTVLDGLRPR